MSVYRIISEERASFPVSLMCELLGVSRSGFNDWSSRAPSDRTLSDAWLTARIKRIHNDNRDEMDRRMGTQSLDPRTVPKTTFVLFVERLDGATSDALEFVRTLRGADFRAVHLQGESSEDTPANWRRWSGSAVDLELLRSNGTTASAVVDYVRPLAGDGDELVDLVIPEQLERRSLLTAFHHGIAFSLRVQLLAAQQVVVTDIRRLDAAGGLRDARMASAVTVALVLLSDVNDVTVQAVRYARSLHANETRAIHVALAPESVDEMRRTWEEWGLPIPLEVVDAPFRSLEEPVLETVRAVTAGPGTLVVVVIPEVETDTWEQDFLRNGDALYLKWLLLFEPRVVLSNVTLRPAPAQL